MSARQKISSLPWTGRKIMIAWSSFALGGAERQMINLARDWRENYCAEVIFWGFFSGGLRQELEKEGFQTLAALSGPNPSPFWRLRRKLGLIDSYMSALALKWLKRIKPDLVVAILTYPNVYLGINWFQVPEIKGFIWNQADMGLGRLRRDWELLALTKASQIITNATGSRDFLVTEFELPQSRVNIVHNIVHLSHCQKNDPALRHQFGLAKNQVAVTMVANLSNYKDHQTLIQAWKIVIDQFPFVSSQKTAPEPILFLAGRKAEKYPALLRQVTDLNLTRSVRFLGDIDSVAALLSVSSIAVLASNSEGSSNAVAEYVLAGLPVVTTPIPANQEIFGPDYHYYYDPGNAQDLAHRLLVLLSDQKLRHQVGQANQDLGQQLFNNRHNLQKYAQLISPLFD